MIFVIYFVLVVLLGILCVKAEQEFSFGLNVIFPMCVCGVIMFACVVIDEASLGVKVYNDSPVVEILTLRNDTKLSGGFILGIGQDNTYVTYIETEKGIQQKTIYSNNTFIKEDLPEDSKVGKWITTYKRKTAPLQNFMIGYTGVKYVDHHTLIVPKGTLFRDFNIK